MEPKIDGSICIKSLINGYPANNFRVILSNSHSKIVDVKCTDNRGCVNIPIKHEDDYEIKVKANRCYSPLVQYKWVHLYPDKKQKIDFKFNYNVYYPFLGSLNITLTDANYPEYTLSKGAYSLWQIF